MFNRGGHFLKSRTAVFLRSETLKIVRSTVQLFKIVRSVVRIAERPFGPAVRTYFAKTSFGRLCGRRTSKFKFVFTFSHLISNKSTYTRVPCLCFTMRKKRKRTAAQGWLEKDAKYVPLAAATTNFLRYQVLLLHY